MKYLKVGSGAVGLVLFTAFTACADVHVVTEHNDEAQASGAFRFKHVPLPSRTDIGTAARFTVVDGTVDDNSGGLARLHDGNLPNEADEPAANFFFDAGTTGGRLLVDLGSVQDLEQVNTYSWHAGPRGPQVYKLYGSEGKAGNFDAQPKRPADPVQSGWKLLANVDTRSKDGEDAGQYGVSISDSQGSLGKWRYLLFDVSRTEDADTFGNTFYSEIDIIDKGHTARATNEVAAAAAAGPFLTNSVDGYCEIAIDTSGAPDLKEWAEQQLAPVLAEWYPKLTTMLASDGFDAPKSFRLVIKPADGVAATGGTRVTANSDWLKHELKGEAIGALLHEEVHVVQQYWRRRSERTQDFKPAPGWLVEGIPDYIRWFLYEPQSHGADLQWLKTRRQRVALKYDARYRVTANFLDFVVTHYDPKKELITKLNAACRQGKYTDELWSQCTGKTLAELDTEWRTTVEKQLAAERAGGASGSGAAPKS